MPKLEAVSSQKHAEALSERDRFLKSHPSLTSLQDKIDRKLAGAQSEHNRLVLIHQLMMDSFRELDAKLQSIRRARQ